MDIQILNWIITSLVLFLMFLLQRSYKSRDSFEKKIREDMHKINDKITDVEKGMIRLEMSIKNLHNDSDC